MRRLILTAALATAAAACAPTREPVEVDWTFGGKSCADAGVSTITIDMDGERLTPNTFTCQEAGQGVALGTFLLGPYTVTVSGYDQDNNLIYQTTATIQVQRGQNKFLIDAKPTTGTATLDWTWGGQTCAAAGVTSVQISVDNSVITGAQGFPCTNSGVDGATIGPLSPGNHTIALAAYGAGSSYYAVDNVVVNVAAGFDTPVQVNVPAAQPTTASADVRWTFGSTGLNCQQVGVDHIWIYFDPPATGSWSKALIADTPCAGMGGAPVTELSIVDVPDGQHTFAIQGTRNNNLTYYTHHPVTTLFTAPFTTNVDVTAEPTP